MSSMKALASFDEDTYQPARVAGLIYRESKDVFTMTDNNGKQYTFSTFEAAQTEQARMYRDARALPVGKQGRNVVGVHRGNYNVAGRKNGGDKG
jgi:hypothetical protein